MKKILYVSGSRSDYGLMAHTLDLIRRSRLFDLEIAATGMHLMKEFGFTVREIKKDGFRVRKIGAVYSTDDNRSMPLFVAKFMLKLVPAIGKIRPDIILLLGDRPEVLTAAAAGAYLMIPVVHIHGGDVSSTVDEPVRHAVTKLAHVHLAATERSAERIVRMGEDRWRVHIVGAPGLDAILNEDAVPERTIINKYDLAGSHEFIIVMQHPVTGLEKDAGRHMAETMEAVMGSGCRAVVIYPNSDPGSAEIIRVIESYRMCTRMQIYRSIPRAEYLALMRMAAAVVGNSSSGIIEAPSLKIPVVNIGEREADRERSGNVIDVHYDRREISDGIKKCLYDKTFLSKVRRCKSPYGSGHAGEKIVRVLKSVEPDKRLLQKKITY